MALQPQRVFFPVTAGQEQGIAEELIDPPALSEAHNVVFTRQGELQKRLGWRTYDESITGETRLWNGDKLARRGNELLWIGGQRHIRWVGYTSPPFRIYSHTMAEGAEDSPAINWQTKNEIPRFNARTFREIVHTNHGKVISRWDMAFAGDSLDAPVAKGVLCIVWMYEGETRIDHAIVDVATKSILYQGELVTNHAAYTSTNLRVIATKGSDGDWFFRVCYMYNFAANAGDMNSVRIKVASPWTVHSEQLVLTAVNGYDVCVTAPSKQVVDASWNFERRIFLISSKRSLASITASIYTLGANGAASSVSTNTWTFADVFIVGGLPVDMSYHCACEPDGRHVACHFGVDAAETHVPCNVVVQWNCADSVTHAITGYDDATVASGTAATASHTGGNQIGWAGSYIDA